MSAELIREDPAQTRDIVPALGFDSITHYQFVHFVDCNRDYREILSDVAREWERIRSELQSAVLPPHFDRLGQQPAIQFSDVSDNEK